MTNGTTNGTKNEQKKRLLFLLTSVVLSRTIINMKRLVITILVFLVILTAAIVLVSTVRYNTATKRMHELSMELDRKIFQWEQMEFKRPPLYGNPVPGNAAVFYAEAEGKLSFVDVDRFKREIGDVFNREQKILGKDACDFCDRSRPLTLLIRQGANTETFKSLADYRTILTKWPFYNSKILLFSQIMLLQARECAEKGDLSSALEWCCITVRYGIDTGCNGTVIGRMMGMASAEMGVWEIIALLNDNELSEEQLAELVRVWGMLIDSNPPWEMSVETEHIAAEIYIRNSAESSYLFSGSVTAGSSASEDIFVKLKRLWINRTDIVALWEKINSQYDEIKKRIKLPVPNITAEYTRINAELRVSDGSDSLPSRLYMPNWLNAAVAIAEYNTRIAGVYILAGLQLYKARRGIYPDSLELLVPDILPVVPLDPFTKRPFFYRTDPLYSMRLYGAGKNMADNGGDYNNKTDLVIFPSEGSMNGILIQLRSGKGVSGKEMLAFAGRGSIGAAKEIAPYLQSKSSYMKENAITALSILNAREFAKDIAPFLRDKNSRIRNAAISALGMFDACGFADEIKPLLKDGNQNENGFAGAVLTELGMQEAVDSDAILVMKILYWKISRLTHQADIDDYAGFLNGKERLREALRKLGVPENEIGISAEKNKDKK